MVKITGSSWKPLREPKSEPELDFMEASDAIVRHSATANCRDRVDGHQSLCLGDGSPLRRCGLCHTNLDNRHRSHLVLPLDLVRDAGGLRGAQLTLVAAAYVAPRYYATSLVADPISLVPTTYVAPRYYATSLVADPISLVPTTYVATTVRRGLLGRRWLVERPVVAGYSATYLPTVAYVPTYYTTSYRERSYRPTVYEYPDGLGNGVLDRTRERLRRGRLGAFDKLCGVAGRLQPPRE